MKKRLLSVVALIAALAMTGCGANNNAAIDTTAADEAAKAASQYVVVNSAKEQADKAGISIEAPEGAENVCYSIMYNTELKEEVDSENKTVKKYVRDESKIEAVQVDFNMIEREEIEENGEKETKLIVIPYTYRASNTGDGLEPVDLSGLDMSQWDYVEKASDATQKDKVVEDITVVGRPGKMYYGNGVGNIYWVDTVPGVCYTLTVGATTEDADTASEKDAITKKELIEMAEKVFVPTQGES